MEPVAAHEVARHDGAARRRLGRLCGIGRGGLRKGEERRALERDERGLTVLRGSDVAALAVGDDLAGVEVEPEAREEHQRAAARDPR